MSNSGVNIDLSCPQSFDITEEMRCNLTVVSDSLFVNINISYGNGITRYFTVKNSTILVRHNYTSIGNFTINASVIGYNISSIENIFIYNCKF